jgi:hypothetical protein
MAHEPLWERIKQGFLESASTAAEKAEYLGKLGRARLDIAGARHAIHEAFAELGGAVYNHLQGSKKAAIDQQEDVQGIAKRIKDLEALLKEREDKLNALRVGKNTQKEQAEEAKA